MPTYEYECAKCGEHVEAFQTFSEEPLKRHNQCEGSKCTGALHKVFSPVGIVLKGSGFYITDYGKDGKKSQTPPVRTGESAPAASGSDSGNKSDMGGKVESKPSGESAPSTEAKTTSPSKSAANAAPKRAKGSE